MSARLAGPMLVNATPSKPVFFIKTIEGTDYKRQTPHLGKLRFQNDSLLVRCKVAGNSYPAGVSALARDLFAKREAAKPLDYLTP